MGWGALSRPGQAHLSRPGAARNQIAGGVNFAPAGSLVFPDPVLAHGANQVGWGGLCPGRGAIFPGWVIAQDNSGLIAGWGGLWPGRDQPASVRMTSQMLSRPGTGPSFSSQLPTHSPTIRPSVSSGANGVKHTPRKLPIPTISIRRRAVTARRAIPLLGKGVPFPAGTQSPLSSPAGVIA